MGDGGGALDNNGSVRPQSPHSKQHLHRFSRFVVTNRQTERQTDRHTCTNGQTDQCARNERGRGARADLAGERDLAGTRPSEVELALFVEDALGSLGLVERHLARHEDVQDNAERPHVRLLRVVRSTLHHTAVAW